MRYFKVHCVYDGKTDLQYDLMKVKENKFNKMYDPFFKKWNKTWHEDFDWYMNNDRYLLREITEAEAFLEIL